MWNKIKSGRHLVLLSTVLLTILLFIFRDHFMAFQGYGLFGLFVLNIAGSATIFLPTPLFLTAFIAGAIFNPFVVAIVASMGSTLGELTGYMAGFGAEDLLEKDAKFKKVKSWMEKYGLWTLFVLGMIPNPFFDIAGIIAGTTEVPVYKYLLVVWLGKLVKFSVLAYAGAHSISLIDKFI